ncbi:DUF4268 domain-containing protein [Winogradskyella aquimaris]|uniref:DUF4268 domain-containing protein n=1 Tax=Winogradskyella aquimaris TaxID=864074 RepID=A0ABU5ETS9_9FLAO|nr:DUF4268 domain-containing protein [Winogradskyella aquimaris]MDY2588209.1 DUF4268 domain-containing protein [Winogradskyella aquimaris]
MYRINREQNNIIKLEERKFSELQFRERENLQEWIAKNPEILGEELLIIQKEFDGFNDTQERLDLLALDKSGNVVVIENKLDDTGRHVVWQALKYVSYCSTLSTTQILKIYQEYLDGQSLEEDAKDNVLEFLDIDEDGLLLNRNDQRIIFVANNYRKEVTSTVLWLLQHSVQIQCFRAIPFGKGEELFLQIEQIIPLPETKEFMIDAMEKELEEKTKSKKVAQTETQLVEFWNKLKSELRNRKMDLLDNVNAKPYFNISTLKGRGSFGFCIGRNGYRVELYIGQDEDKVFFDAMRKYKLKIQNEFKLGDMVWERLDGKKAARIKFERSALDITGDVDGWRKNPEAIINWYCDVMKPFYDVLLPYWMKVNNEID